ncbi:MAG TPA: aldo/keto reductase [Kofleriaceae bacterium]|nr:aldo/keto reductase [Kofleriaceae bacterium]
MQAPDTIQLGSSGPRVYPIALGCMGMSAIYGPTDDETSVRVIQSAIERGVNLIDTGDFYASGHNELLVGKAIEGRRDRVLLSVKFGVMRTPDGGWSGADCRPAAVKNFAAYSLKRLGVDVIDIYRPARLDPNVPIEDTVGAIKDLIDKGYVRHVGLSEVGVDTIRRAHAVHPIADLQIEYSLLSRDPEDRIFPALAELGISATLYGVLSRGLLAGAKLAPGDARAHMPRFQSANAEQNQKLAEAVRRLATEWGMTPGQLVIGWARAKQPALVPLIGARTPQQLDDALAARPLTAEQVAAVEAAVPRGAVAGTRYHGEQMKHLDSER